MKKISKKTKVIIGIITALVVLAAVIAIIVFGGNGKNDNASKEENTGEVEIESKAEDKGENETENKGENETENKVEDEVEIIGDVVKHQYGIVYDDKSYTYTCRWEAEYNIKGELVKKTYYDSTGYRKIETYEKDELEKTTTVIYEVVDKNGALIQTFNVNPHWETEYEDINNVEVVSTYYEDYERKGAKYEILKMEPFGGEAILYNGELYVDLSGVLKQENKEVLDTLKLLYGENVMDKISKTIENCATYEIDGLGKIKAIKVETIVNVRQIANNVGHDIDDMTKNGIIIIRNDYYEEFIPFSYLIEGLKESMPLTMGYEKYYGVINYEYNGNKVSFLIEEDGNMLSTGRLTQSSLVGLEKGTGFLTSNINRIDVYRHDLEGEVSCIQTIIYDENGNIKENIERNTNEISAIPVIKKENIKETKYDPYNRVVKEIYESGNYVEYTYSGNYKSGQYIEQYYDLNADLLLSVYETYVDNKLTEKEISVGAWEDYNVYVYKYTYFKDDIAKDYSSIQLRILKEAFLYEGEVYVEICDGLGEAEWLEDDIITFYDEEEGEKIFKEIVKAYKNSKDYELGSAGIHKAIKLDVDNVRAIYKFGSGQEYSENAGIIMLHNDNTVSIAYDLDIAQGKSEVTKLDLKDIVDVFWFNMGNADKYFVNSKGEMLDTYKYIHAYFEK